MRPCSTSNHEMGQSEFAPRTGPCRGEAGQIGLHDSSAEHARMDKEPSQGAVAAVLGRELDLDHLVRALIDRWRPAEAGPARGARRPLVLPVDCEVLRVEALPRPGLPAVVAAGRAKQLDPIILPARHQEFGIEKAGVDDMDTRQEIAVLERRVDRGRHRAVGRRPGRRLDVGDQLREFAVARLGDMDLVPDPLGGALLGVVGVRVMRGADEDGTGRDVLRAAPAERPIDALILLDPDLAQRLD